MTATTHSSIHLSRRLQHLTTGLLLLVISHLLIPPYPLGSILLSLATLILLHSHRRRCHDEAFNKWYLETFGSLLRPDERGSPTQLPILPGAFYFLLGTALTSALCEASAARTALLVLSVADPLAGAVGSAKRPNLGGFVACAMSTVLCTWVYIPSWEKRVLMMGSSMTLTWPDRILVGVATALVETYAGRHVDSVVPIDDNLCIPLVVGVLVSWLMRET